MLFWYYTVFFFLLLRLPPISTLTVTLFPYTPFFRSSPCRSALRSSTHARSGPAGRRRRSGLGSRGPRYPSVQHEHGTVLAVLELAADQLGAFGQPDQAQPRARGGGGPETERVAHHEVDALLRVGTDLHEHRGRSEENPYELQSLIRISYAVF